MSSSRIEGSSKKKDKSSCFNPPASEARREVANINELTKLLSKSSFWNIGYPF